MDDEDLKIATFYSIISTLAFISEYEISYLCIKALDEAAAQEPLLRIYLFEETADGTKFIVRYYCLQAVGF